MTEQCWGAGVGGRSLRKGWDRNRGRGAKWKHRMALQVRSKHKHGVPGGLERQRSRREGEVAG
jgi:hypothetical protein